MDVLQAPWDSGRRLTPKEVDAALAVIQDAFRQCRPLILERAGSVAHTNKQDGTPVTDTDLEVEKTLLAALARHMPDVPVYGEETGYAEDLTGAFWLLDPIDGTKSFIADIPAYTSMAVLIQDGEAIASAIYNIAHDDMYIAQKGRGAYKNGVRLDLRAVPLPHTAICKGHFIGALNTMMQTNGVVCETGESGGGHGFAMVAEGSSAARFNMPGGGYIHDYAPGALLVREAGGVLIPVGDDIYTYKSRSFIACHPDLESILRPHVLELRALEAEMRDKA
jgi:myo-inositol-1(or 4)-monophosphatase